MKIEIGKHYLIPCVYGKATPTRWDDVSISKWWPVMLPKHDDSNYLAEDGIATGAYHYHIDPRFTPLDYYASELLVAKLFHGSIVPDFDKVKYKKFLCLRKMPIPGKVFRLFGQKFIEDHEGKQVKCNKCPHKGIDLTDAPTIDGIVVCPAHGMRFKDNLCVFDEQDKAYKL